MPFYGLAEAKVGGKYRYLNRFSGEAGYEIYLRNATLYAEDMWNVLKAGKKHKLMVIAQLTTEEFKQEYCLGDKIWIISIILFSAT